MDAQELRIGNYVYAQSGRISKIEREDFAYHVGLANLEDNEPIPLTEGWLLKLGLKEVEGVFVKGHLKLLAIRDLYWRANYPIIVDVIHVHQLQNLYFALTGEELQLK